MTPEADDREYAREREKRILDLWVEREVEKQKAKNVPKTKQKVSGQ